MQEGSLAERGRCTVTLKVERKTYGVQTEKSIYCQCTTPKSHQYSCWNMDWRLCKTEHTYSQYIIKYISNQICCVFKVSSFQVSQQLLLPPLCKKRFHLIMMFICQQTATESHACINAEQFETADIQIKHIICSKEMKSVQYF